MRSYAVNGVAWPTARRRRLRTRQHSHPWDNRPAPPPYRDGVPPAPDVNRVRFSRFVARLLADARSRNMTDRDIAKATGVNPSTFHRWQRGDINGAPSIGRVRAFCVGLGVNPRAALLALGLDEGRDSPEPEPALDPDFRMILRALADPNTPDSDKAVIREMLRMLAQRVRRTPPTGDRPNVQS